MNWDNLRNCCSITVISQLRLEWTIIQWTAQWFSSITLRCQRFYYSRGHKVLMILECLCRSMEMVDHGRHTKSKSWRWNQKGFMDWRIRNEAAEAMRVKSRHGRTKIIQRGKTWSHDSKKHKVLRHKFRILHMNKTIQSIRLKITD